MTKRLVDGCPFCENLKSNKFFAESDKFVAIYNQAPILPGHSLVIPKWHLTNFMELSQYERYELIDFCTLVIEGLQLAFSVSSFNLTIQEGFEAGQTVDHLHIHLIPRKIDDMPNPGDWYPALKKSENSYIDSKNRIKLKENDFEKIVDHLRRYFGES